MPIGGHQQALDPAAAQRSRGLRIGPVGDEGPGHRVHVGDAGGAGADPESAVGVEGERGDEVRGQRLGVFLVGAPDGETVARRLVAGETATTGTDPQPSSGIDRQRPHVVVRQAVRIVEIPMVGPHGVAVEAAQTVGCGDPDEALSVLGKGVDGDVGQPLLHRQVLETQRLVRPGRDGTDGRESERHAEQSEPEASSVSSLARPR